MSTVVMTGGTSGFGATAATLLDRSGHRVILGARRPTGEATSIPLDLARLDSVREFATSVRERLVHTPVDALVLNAGVIHSDDTGRTVDGYETTFAINHLAHYLLIRLLLPTLADRAVVVLTTSGAHDPATGAGLRPPRHADATLLAHPERDTERDRRPRAAGEHAYTASKLCAVLTANALAEHPDARARHVTVIAYCPGQVFGTGLATRTQRRLGERPVARQRPPRRPPPVTRGAWLRGTNRTARPMIDPGWLRSRKLLGRECDSRPRSWAGVGVQLPFPVWCVLPRFRRHDRRTVATELRAAPSTE